MNGEKLVTAPNGDKIFAMESFDSAFEAILGESVTGSDKEESMDEAEAHTDGDNH